MLLRVIHFFIYACIFVLSVNGQIPSDSTQKVYRDKEYSFSVHYPADWKPLEASSTFTRFKIAIDSFIGYADFSIVARKSPELSDMTPGEFVNGLARRPEIVRAMVETGLPGSTVLASGKTYLSSREAFFIKSTGTMRRLDDETELIIYQIVTVFEGKSFTLTCRSLKEPLDLYFDKCKEIASSFVLEPTKINLPAKKGTRKRAKK